MLKSLKQTLLNYSTPQHYYLQNSIRDFSKKIDHVSLIIDIGCGYSPFIEKFSYKRRILVDIEKRGDIDFLSDVQSLAIKDNSAELVLLTEVLEHVPDENKTLSEIYRILRPNGWFIVSVPFLFGVHETVDYRRWTAQGLRKQLQEQGYNITDFRYRGGCFSTLLCLWRNMPRELLGGDFRSFMAKVFVPLIGLHFVICLLLTPIVIFLDRLDKKKLSSTGYIVLCRRSAKI
jgi:SAM-dependent methyltransferase